MSADWQQQFNQFSFAYPRTGLTAGFKQQVEDFIVDEVLPFELTDEGEHAWLHIRKTDSNTDWVAGQIANYAEVKKANVGYAGLKDRFGITSQWFSVYLPGREVDWHDFNVEGVAKGIEILTATRHQKKLQRGALKSNRFKIRLRDLSGDPDLLQAQCELIQKQGVPNYFGEQRFGRGFSNMDEAERMFLQPRKRLPRHKRSLYLSAARSWLFNHIVSQRVAAGNWNRKIKGDVFMLDGRSACFSDDASADLDARLASGEIHPTAVMWGDGDSMAKADCAALESSIIDGYPLLRDGLVAARVAQQRRATRLMVKDLLCEQDGSDMVLKFSLQSGSYATMVLRELVEAG
jgi:tRNA pseudouridine13 synthase